jgi:hypothetical protein
LGAGRVRGGWLVSPGFLILCGRFARSQAPARIRMQPLAYTASTNVTWVPKCAASPTGRLTQTCRMTPGAQYCTGSGSEKCTTCLVGDGRLSPVSRRYERGSIIVTSNRSASNGAARSSATPWWPALIDRLVHQPPWSRSRARATASGNGAPGSRPTSRRRRSPGLRLTAGTTQRCSFRFLKAAHYSVPIDAASSTSTRRRERLQQRSRLRPVRLRPTSATPAGIASSSRRASGQASSRARHIRLQCGANPVCAGCDSDETCGSARRSTTPARTTR